MRGPADAENWESAPEVAAGAEVLQGLAAVIYYGIERQPLRSQSGVVPYARTIRLLWPVSEILPAERS